ncbi:S8 family serine peptidase [Actinomadura rayongensis]|uniref:S8 family serine peptidase n=1 Tax=Actinomadura rayongensis TaxID=1429076 RepID=A0A6I4W9P6_9ACTN|nr:S8 family serine peptidase [Actinomadura rayongensis]MXQ64786.1 S8 family serine peptidase [Actinomadura rayongensis]
MTRWLSAVGASSVLVLTGSPAGAAPGPLPQEWWFKAWDIQHSVWPVSKGAGVTVAVIDTGVNANLPDLKDAVLPGKDFLGGYGDAQGSGDGRTDTDVRDGGHGTGMASLIASRGTGTGFVGVAPESKILPILSSTVSLPEAIRYAADHGAGVVSISQGTPALQNQCEPGLQQAIGYALDHNVVIVASAGNDGNGVNSVKIPAVCAGVLVAGALDNQKNVYANTERHPYVSVAAPGYLVGALQKDGRFNPQLSGTSQAGALTAGAVALVRSKFPNMSNREIVQRIIGTAKDVGPSGKDEQTGYGVVIPSAALTANVPKNAPNPVFAKYDKWKASQPKTGDTPTTPKTKSATEKNNDKAARNTKILLIGVGVVALLVIVVGGLLILRNRGRKNPPPPPPGAPGTPPSWGGTAGPGRQVPPQRGPGGQPYSPQPGPGQPPQAPPGGFGPR